MKLGYQINNKTGFDLKVRDGLWYSDIIPNETDPFFSSDHEAWLEVYEVDEHGNVKRSLGDLRITNTEGHVDIMGPWKWNISRGLK